MPSLPTDCGGLIYFVSNDLLKIESPNYPDPSAPNLHCSWTVHGTPGSTIKGTFISFELHTSSASLSVYDGVSDDDATLVLSATGSIIPPTFTASQAVTVVFTTGPIAQQSGGFSLVLVLIAACSPTVCHNDGVCLESNDGIVYCVCPPGYTGITCESFESVTTSNNNQSKTESLGIDKWTIVLVSVAVVLLIILAIIVGFVHHRQSCRGPIVADYHAWQLRKTVTTPIIGPDSRTSSHRDDSHMDSPPRLKRKDSSPVSVAPRHAESDLEQALSSAARSRLDDIDGSPWLPTRRMFRHIQWNTSNSPNHSYKIAQALIQNGDDSMDETMLETMLSTREVYHPDFHIDLNDDDDVDNDDDVGNGDLENDSDIGNNDDVHNNDEVESGDDDDTDDDDENVEYVVNADDDDENDKDVDEDAKEDDVDSCGASSMGLDEFMIDMLRKKEEGTEMENVHHTSTRL